MSTYVRERQVSMLNRILPRAQELKISLDRLNKLQIDRGKTEENLKRTIKKRKGIEEILKENSFSSSTKKELDQKVAELRSQENELRDSIESMEKQIAELSTQNNFEEGILSHILEALKLKFYGGVLLHPDEFIPEHLETYIFLLNEKYIFSRHCSLRTLFDVETIEKFVELLRSKCSNEAFQKIMETIKED